MKSGNLMLRMKPELHEAAQKAADDQGAPSLNWFLNQVIAKGIGFNASAAKGRKH